jgi:hypothetical protein
MMKFQSDHRELGINGYSKQMPLFLNRQLILVLSARGVDDGIFMELLNDMILLLDQALVDDKMAQSLLLRHSVREDAGSDIREMDGEEIGAEVRGGIREDVEWKIGGKIGEERGTDLRVVIDNKGDFDCNFEEVLGDTMEDKIGGKVGGTIGDIVVNKSVKREASNAKDMTQDDSQYHSQYKNARSTLSPLIGAWHMLESGMHIRDEPYLQGLLHSVRNSLLLDLQKKARIFVDKGICLIGG